MGLAVSIFKKTIFLHFTLYLTVSVVRRRNHATEVPEVPGRPTARGIRTLLKHFVCDPFSGRVFLDHQQNTPWVVGTPILRKKSSLWHVVWYIFQGKDHTIVRKMKTALDSFFFSCHCFITNKIQFKTAEWINKMIGEQRRCVAALLVPCSSALTWTRCCLKSLVSHLWTFDLWFPSTSIGFVPLILGRVAVAVGPPGPFKGLTPTRNVKTTHNISDRLCMQGYALMCKDNTRKATKPNVNCAIPLNCIFH